MKMKGYIEYVAPESRIGFIITCFNKVVYFNNDWPNGEWETAKGFGNAGVIKARCKKGRTFNKEELMLELL